MGLVLACRGRGWGKVLHARGLEQLAGAGAIKYVGIHGISSIQPMRSVFAAKCAVNRSGYDDSTAIADVEGAGCLTNLVRGAKKCGKRWPCSAIFQRYDVVSSVLRQYLRGASRGSVVVCPGRAGPAQGTLIEWGGHMFHDAGPVDCGNREFEAKLAKYPPGLGDRLGEAQTLRTDRRPGALEEPPWGHLPGYEPTKLGQAPLPDCDGRAGKRGKRRWRSIARQPTNWAKRKALRALADLKLQDNKAGGTRKRTTKRPWPPSRRWGMPPGVRLYVRNWRGEALAPPSKEAKQDLEGALKHLPENGDAPGRGALPPVVG